MCGIIGVWALKNGLISESLIGEMIAKLRHRGPDDQGKLTLGSLGLGHTRLSIHDLSQAGHQPMFSALRKWVIVFNGEIYNHLDLRKQLSVDSRQRQWKGHSDTETLLACFEAWGIEQTLAKTVGMFALALWDKQKRKLLTF